MLKLYHQNVKSCCETAGCVTDGFVASTILELSSLTGAMPQDVGSRIMFDHLPFQCCQSCLCPHRCRTLSTTKVFCTVSISLTMQEDSFTPVILKLSHNCYQLCGRRPPITCKSTRFGMLGPLERLPVESIFAPATPLVRLRR